jgi:hypothetical protein
MELWLPLVDFYLNLHYRNIVGHVGLVSFYHSLNNSGMPSRGTVKRIGGTMITRVMSHLFLVLMHYRKTFLVGLMTQFIKSKYFFLVWMEITRELCIKFSILMPKSQCTPDGRCFME